jgi:hypothetical protein
MKYEIMFDAICPTLTVRAVQKKRGKREAVHPLFSLENNSSERFTG